MKNSLGYTKRILETVSFDKDLFFKELQKATKYLLPYEIEQLYIWVKDYLRGKPELGELAAEVHF